MKQCRTCNQNKPLSDFPKNPDSKDGFRSECKLCRKQKNNIGHDQEDRINKVKEWAQSILDNKNKEIDIKDKELDNKNKEIKKLEYENTMLREVIEDMKHGDKWSNI